MRYLKGDEKEEASKFIEVAQDIAKNSTCKRSKCGSLIIKNGEIIGRGFNSPPANKEIQRRCQKDKKELHEKVTDKTCCIHAEQRAIMDALSKNPDKLKNSKLFFIRLKDDENLSFAGKPYCTICSKMALDVGIKEFILYHEEGICVYDTGEYNLLSYKYTN